MKRGRGNVDLLGNKTHLKRRVHPITKNYSPLFQGGKLKKIFRFTKS